MQLSVLGLLLDSAAAYWRIMNGEMKQTWRSIFIPCVPGDQTMPKMRNNYLGTFPKSVGETKVKHTQKHLDNMSQHPLNPARFTQSSETVPLSEKTPKGANASQLFRLDLVHFAEMD